MQRFKIHVITPLLNTTGCVKYIHTYITGHYNLSVRIIDLVSHTTYVVCVNFIHKWRDQQFNVDSERQIFLSNFSWHLITHRVFAINLLRGNPRRNTFHILFWCLAWCSNPGFSSNTIARILLSILTKKIHALTYSGNVFSSYSYLLQCSGSLVGIVLDY